MRMMRCAAAVVLAAGLGVGAVVAAGPGGGKETAAQIRERLAALKAEEAALEAKLAAMEGGAAKGEPGLVTALNAMPKNLWPGESDNQTKEQLREKWLSENVKAGTVYAFTGTVAVSTPVKINEAGKPSTDGMQVSMDCGKQMIWGKEKGLRVVAVVRVKPEEAVDWNEKTVLTISGKSASVRTEGNPVEVRMETCERK
jgi:hypothetical protein